MAIRDGVRFVGFVLTFLFALVDMEAVNAQNGVSGCPAYPSITSLDQSLFTNILTQVDEYIADVTTANNVPGFVASIVYDQHTIFSKGYGKVNASSQTNSAPPTGDDLVEIASISKVFTDLLLFYMRDHQLLDLNDAVSTFLPEFSILSIYESDQPIRLVELASQTSGLQREVPYPCSFSLSCNETQVLQALADTFTVVPPFSRFHYSNLGISLLGRAIEKVYCKSAGGCFEQKVKELILDGLGFSSYSGFNFSAELLHKHAAQGIAEYHVYSNGSVVAIPARIQSLGWENPAGGMLASANDLALLMQFLFRNNISASTSDEREEKDADANQILDGATITELLSPRTLLRDGSQAIGYPWEMDYVDFQSAAQNGAQKTSGVWYKGKQGELSGYRSSVAIIPDYKLGVFTSALISDVPSPTVWSYEILDMLLPVLDGLLYKYTHAAEYVLPTNYQLLVGEYSNTVTIQVMTESNSGLQYLHAFDIYGDNLRLSVFDDGKKMGILRAHNLNDEACRELDDGQDQELMYFQFENGSNNHATSFIFMSNKFPYGQ